jgi:hypothetical protein
MNTRTIATVGTATLVAAGIAEGFNAATQQTFYQHFTSSNWPISAIEAGIWLLAAVSLLMRPTWGWYPLALATLAAMAHTAILAVSGNLAPAGAFLFVSIVSAFCFLRLAMGRTGEQPWFALDAKGTGATPRQPQLVHRTVH